MMWGDKIYETSADIETCMFMHLLTHNLIFSHRHVAMETTTAFYSHCHMAKDKGDVGYLCSSLPHTHTHTHRNDFTMKQVPESHTHTHTHIQFVISPRISNSQHFMNEIIKCIGIQGVVGKEKQFYFSLSLCLASFGIIYPWFTHMLLHRALF